MTSLRNELRALLISPVTWAMVTGYIVFSGIFFVVLLFGRGIADLESYYSNIETTLVVLAPIVAMRSFAEERRTGALDITLSWPTSRWWLVTTKFVANTLLTWLIVSIVWLYVWLLNRAVDVELGKNTAGYIGLLMILLMFNAISLAISARSRSPATAAFVGFGVLIALWVLDFVPGWLGGRFEGVVAYLAPTNHIANSGRGLLDLGDGLYFVAGMGLGLCLAVLWLREPRPRSFDGVIRGRYAGILLGLLVTAGVGGGSIVAKGQVDLTPEKRFTLTDHSRFVLNAVDSPTTIYGFVEPGLCPADRDALPDPALPVGQRQHQPGVRRSGRTTRPHEISGCQDVRADDGRDGRAAGTRGRHPGDRGHERAAAACTDRPSGGVLHRRTWRA